MKLNIEVKSNDLPIIKRMKKSLLNKFNPNSENDVEKAIELANYLVILKEYQQARDYLESFVYFNPNDREEELWVTNAQGVLLLVHIYRITEQAELYEKIASVLDKNDILPVDIGTRKWIKMHIEDHEKKIKYALTETQKHKCAFIGQEVLSFMYFYEMVFVFKKQGMLLRTLLKDVEKIFDESKDLLLEALQN